MDYDANNIYFTTDFNFNVYYCPLSQVGVAAVEMYSFSSQDSTAIATSGDGNIYWIAGSCILTCPWSNCFDSVIVSCGQYADIVVDAVNIYAITDGVISQISRAITTVVVDIADVAASNIVVVDGSVFFADFFGGTIESCAIGGCGSNFVVYAEDEPSYSPTQVAVFEGIIYWINIGESWNIVYSVALPR